MNPQVSCPLCLQTKIQSSFINLQRTFYECANCSLVFVDPQHHLNKESEKKRYETHQNDILDPGYQKFVTPLFEIIKSKVSVEKSGLDFGAGTGPVLAKLLNDCGFKIELYDPFFHPNPTALAKKYDFIFASEVAEHFYSPQREFSLLDSLLEPSGFLFLMTLIMTEQTPRETWFYLKDPTHVCAYSLKTFEWIKKRYHFSKMEVFEPRVVAFEK